MKIFISSRMNEELEKERLLTVKTIDEMKHKAIAFELEPAGGHVEEWWDRRIMESDVFVLLLNKSVSRAVYNEVECARRYKKIVFIFVKDADYVLRQNAKDLERVNVSDDELERFREYATRLKFKQFESENEFSEEIKKAIASLPLKITKIPEELLVSDNELERIRTLYVPPKEQFFKAQRILESKGFLILIGPAHVGKTATAHYLLSQTRNKLNLDTIVKCSDYRDTRFLADQKDIGILLDDPFGKTEYRSTMLGMRINELYRELSERNYIVITSREEIFSIAETRTEIGERGSIEDYLVRLEQEGVYSDEDLIRILEKHLSYYLKRGMISDEEVALGRGNSRQIISDLRFPHNLDRLVAEELRKVTAKEKRLDKAIEDAKYIARQARNWYYRLAEDKKYDKKYFVLIVALLPGLSVSLINYVYKLVLNVVSQKFGVFLPTINIEELRMELGSYITEVGVVDFKHPSYREGILAGIEATHRGDLDLIFPVIQQLARSKTSDVTSQTTASQAIANALGEIGKVRPNLILSLLEGLIKDKEPNIRLTAMDTLERLIMVKSDPFLPLLQKMAKDSDGDIRESIARIIARALMRTGVLEYDLVFLILEDLTRDNEINVKDAAISALEQTARTRPEDTLRLLEPLTKDESFFIRRRVIAALKEADKVMPYLVQPLSKDLARSFEYLTKDIDWKNRQGAAEALGKLGGLIPKDAFSLLRPLAKDQNLFVRRAVIDALNEVAEVAPDIVFPPLRELIVDSDYQVRMGVAFALEKASKAELDSGLPLLKKLTRDEHWQVRKSAVKALGGLAGVAPGDVFNLLKPLTKDQDPYIQRITAEALGRLGEAPSDTVLPILKQMAKDEDASIRWAAACAVRELAKKCPDGVWHLVIELANDPAWNVKRAIAEAFEEVAKTSSEQFFLLFRELTENENENVRCAVVGAIEEVAKTTPDLALPLLEKLARDKDEDTRWTATYAIGGLVKVRIDLFLPLLQELAEDENRNISGPARWVLRKLTSARKEE